MIHGIFDVDTRLFYQANGNESCLVEDPGDSEVTCVRSLLQRVILNFHATALTASLHQAGFPYSPVGEKVDPIRSIRAGEIAAFADMRITCRRNADSYTVGLSQCPVLVLALRMMPDSR